MSKYVGYEMLKEACEDLYGPDSCYMDEDNDYIYIGPDQFMICYLRIMDGGVFVAHFRASLTPEPTAILMRIFCDCFGLDNVKIGPIWELNSKGKTISGNMAVYYTACNIFDFWFGTKDKKEAKQVALDLDKKEKDFELELESSELERDVPKEKPKKVTNLH